MNESTSRQTGFSFMGKGFFWPAFFLVFGFVCITLHQSDYFRAIPGNMGDARFNNIILEHLFRWFSGKDTSLWSPPYFYPYPGSLSFSDNHFGTGLAYILMRLFGMSPEMAFIGWYTLAAPLNFISCYYAFRQLGLSPRGSAVGAFIFTFAFNVSARHGHAQLSYRFAIPLAILAAQRLLETRSPKQLAKVVLWVTIQFYCSIYLGYFLALLLIAYAIMQSLVRITPGVSRPIEAIFASLREAWAGRKVGSIATISLCFGALAFLFYPYVHFSKLYQLSRGSEEILSMLPRLRSYLLADDSPIWGRLGASVVGLPMRWEHQMFFGAATCVLAAIGAIRKPDRAAKVALGAIAFLFVLTIDIRGHSIYALLVNLPLVNAIRAVTRIGLVMIFPVAFLAGRGFDLLTSSSRRRSAKVVAAFALVAFMLVEYATYRTETVPLKDLDHRMAGLLSLLPPQLPRDAILFVPVPPGHELDGMALANATNRATLNGYSGNIPPGFGDPGPDECDVVANRLANYAAFANLTYDDYVKLVSRVVVVGRTEQCPPLPPQSSRTHFSGSVPMEVVLATTLRILDPRVVNGRLIVTLEIDNRSSGTLRSISDDNRPIRFSWRLIPSHSDVGPYDGWLVRKNLTFDVNPGERRAANATIAPPKEPGEYRIESSLVQENTLWFHQFNMPIARSATLIQVHPDGSLSIVPGDDAR